ncbi:MAG: hypothetical protein DBX59_10430 [Bacillota bacterium]|nr:MAG: hypothetical protein DBX59_10430 [Bacillota bacterium]
MKIYAISDLHISADGGKPMEVFGGNWVGYLEKIVEDWEKKVTDNDLVLIGGDISWAMHLEDAIKDLSLIFPLKGKKILIRGNHDYWWSGIGRVRAALPENVYALQNDAVKIENVVVCGSRAWSVPDSPDFKEADEKIYKRETERLRLSFHAANKLRQEGDKLVALVHYPPFNVRRESSDFTDLFEKNNVNAVVYGHLHGQNSRGDRLVKKNGIDYYLTSCDMVDNKLTEIKL